MIEWKEQKFSELNTKELGFRKGKRKRARKRTC